MRAVPSASTLPNRSLLLSFSKLSSKRFYVFQNQETEYCTYAYEWAFTINCNMDCTDAVVCDMDAPSIALGSQVGASQTSQIAGQPDHFDDPDPDEYVGVNDEDIYCHSDEAVHEEHIGPDLILENEEATIDDAVDNERVVAFDPENPKIAVGELFPNVDAFKKSLRHFAIKNEFEVCTVKSDKTRFIGKCKDSSCPWRIHASRLHDKKTFMVKVLPHDHSCPSTTMVDGKMASSSWVSDRVGVG
ncbi:uncharacterized protein LOC144543943 [Carex rostrata]